MGQEKNFENRIKNFLKGREIYYIKYWGGGNFTKTGVPDLLACVNGYFVAIEVKAPNGEPSELQLYNIKKINECNGFGLALYPNQFEKFKDFIDYLEFDEILKAEELLKEFNEGVCKCK